ncbi:hypothetical protein SAML1593_39240 [Salmonella enterica]|nr:hypothetical protein SAML1593_39240 [Salmonella enterica]BCQ97586.1 hypothetical protein SAML1960_39060 [Salmonella enterica]BCR02287.1 hypothetical protein SAML2008_39950 [Salmonella enterica]
MSVVYQSVKASEGDVPTGKNNNAHRGQLYYPQKPGNTALAEAESEVQGDLLAGLLAMGKSC